MADRSDDEYQETVEMLIVWAADLFRSAQESDWRALCARYFARGAHLELSTGELVDFLGVSAGSVLDRAGYGEEDFLRVMDLVGELSDEEIARAEP